MQEREAHVRHGFKSGKCVELRHGPEVHCRLIVTRVTVICPEGPSVCDEDLVPNRGLASESNKQTIMQALGADACLEAGVVDVGRHTRLVLGLGALGVVGCVVG